MGTTSLLKRFISKKFFENTLETLGADFGMGSMTIDEKEGSKKIDFRIWDFSGSNKYEHVRSIYYKDTRGIAIVFDLSNRESFDQISKYWIMEIQNNLHGQKIALVLVGNKSDKTDTVIEVSEGEELAEKMSQIFNTETKYIETSARSGENVDLVFETLGKMILQTK